MLHIAMLDDDPAFLEGFSAIVQEQFRIHGFSAEISCFLDWRDFLERIGSFDLLWMDIDMPEKNGIEIAAELRGKQLDTPLIFVSAHDHFVFESIQYTPFRFIRKKYVQPETEEAVAAFCRRYRKQQEQQSFYLENGETCDLPLMRIMGFYAIRHEVSAIDENGTSIALQARRYTMEQLEEMLQAHGFLRVHKSYLINYRFIYQIRQDKLLLHDAAQQCMTIPMSRRRTVEIRQAYHALLGEEES